MSMTTNFDPRAWNLLAGVALLSAGCGSRVASQEAGDTGETADTTPDSAEDPECVDFNDCPVGYGCYDGVCMYYPHHDGWVPYYDCYSDSECGEFYIYEFGYCEGLPPSPDCEALGLAWPPPTPIDVGTEALALTFADVDADGQDELVVATATQLLVYQSEGGEPIASSNTSQPILDMVAGDFDASPGEDVLLLIADDTLALRGSNGDGTFADPIESPLQLGFVNGLFAGDFDGQPPIDLLGWGGAGAFLDSSGQVQIFDTSQIAAAAVHELGSAEPGFALRRGTNIDIYTLDAQLVMSWGDIPGSSLAAFDREFFSQYVFVSATYEGWSRVQTRGGAEPPDEWSIHGTPTHVFAGDLDGTETDELVYVQDGGNAYVHYNPRQDGDCHEQLFAPVRGAPIDAVFGDHDGDGDQELALHTNAAEIVVFDGG